jgi:5'-nucleotidase (lipoprotein e(P4) family)
MNAAFLFLILTCLFTFYIPFEMSKKINIPLLWGYAFLVISAFSCDTFRTRTKPDIPENEILFSTLYNYYSAEYKALALQAFNLAAERIIQIREKNPENDSLAVVLDLDETVLDNSPYQAKLILDNIEYDSLWNEWCNLAIARAIPGALDFVLLADSLGMEVFYLSNRKEEYVLHATMENLKKLRFPQVTKENMLLRTSTSNKEPRRNMISQSHDICLLVGDNLGDFFVDEEDSPDRDNQVAEYADHFGDKFIILPNAMYGNWVQSLNLLDDPRQAGILLDSMVMDFETKLYETY